MKAKNAGQTGSQSSYEPRITVTPKHGVRKARVSLIVDLGVQQREDFEENGVSKPQKPCQQVAVFADLVNDVVDYGGTIGKAQYRLLLNKQFGNDISGINYTTTPQKDPNGNILDRPWIFHPQNILTKLCKAVDRADICESTEIDELLSLPFMADVEVRETEGKKEDENGNKVIFKHVNFKGASKVPMTESDDLDEDGNAIEIPTPVAELKVAPRCITFDNAKAEDIQFIRLGLIKKIKLAEDYAGSQMQTAIEEFEASKGAIDAGADDGDQGEAPPKTKVTPAKPKEKKPLAKAESKPKTGFDAVDDDVPFN